MRTGKELLMATKAYAKEIRWKSWYTMLSTLLLLVGSIVATLFIPYLPVRIATSVFTAMMLSRFFIIFHDYQHHTILRNAPLAEGIFTVFGIYMVTPPSIWKRSHDHHHNNNAKLYSASIGSYPIMTKQKFLEATPAERFEYLAVRHPLNMFFAYFTTFNYGMCIQSLLSNPKKHWDSAVVLAIHHGIGVLFFVYFGWLSWLLAFFLPFFLSHMLGAYLFYAQHNFPTATYRNNVDWNYVDAAIESSSYMPMNPFMQWVTANIGFHHIHHLNSKIPFYRLPEAMAGIPELQQARKTLLTPSAIVACLKLKVWDSEQNRMIGFDEIYRSTPPKKVVINAPIKAKI